MKERPILFSGAMVRALLAGSKTQTRRVVKITHRTPGLAACLMPPAGLPARPRVAAELCPYGQPGDRLWVRESTYRRPQLNLLTGEPLDPKYGGGAYTADDDDVLTPEGFDLCWWYSRKACPSIHMPRWASRILLEITEVRVERLQDISRGDAMAEGCPFPNMATGPDPRKWYADLWECLGGRWDANPWVWAVSFRIVTPTSRDEALKDRS
jgi:hypothetical protein